MKEFCSLNGKENLPHYNVSTSKSAFKTGRSLQSSLPVSMAFEEWMAKAMPGGHNWWKQKFEVFFFFSPLLHCEEQLMYEYNYQLPSDGPKYTSYELEWATTSPVGKSYNKNRLWCLSLDVKYPFLSHIPQNIYALKAAHLQCPMCLKAVI